jgi:DNA mismatch repair protein MutS
MKLEYEHLSFLWQSSDIPRHIYVLDNKVKENLNLKEMMDDVTEQLGYPVDKIMSQLVFDKETLEYRQEILTDFIQHQEFFQWLQKTIKRCYDIKNLIKFAFEREATLYNLIKRMEESEEIMKITHEVLGHLRHMDCRSRGFIAFKKNLESIVASDIYVNYEKDLHTIKKMDTGIKSIKIGMNLDAYLNPYEAIILSLEEEPFRYTRTMKKVSKIINAGFSELKSIPRRIFAPETTVPKDELNLLEKLIEPAMRQLINFCDTFNTSLLEVYAPLQDELSFYGVGILNYKHVKEMGYTCCLPVFTEEEETQIKGLYNLNLAYYFKKRQLTQKEMVYNQFVMEKEGNIIILTGANRGGKTTYTQSVGQSYWLGFLGFHIPASHARIKMIDQLLIHFPSDEGDSVDYGRLGEECQRFAAFFDVLTPRSLILMNESFSGTSHDESLSIAKEGLLACQQAKSSAIL